MITGYFDDSGTHSDAATVTMAGFIAPDEAWKKFERASDRLFKKEGVAVFHAKEFYHGKNEFSGWSDARKLRFATEWFDIAAPWVMRGATRSADKASYAKVKKEHGLVQNTSAYGFCLGMVLKDLCADAEVWQAIETKGLSLIAESATPGRDRGLENEFERIAKLNKLEKYFRPLNHSPKNSSRALQMADYLAYFSWRQSEKAALRTLNSRCPFHDIALERIDYIYYGLAEDFKPNPDFAAQVEDLKRQFP